MMPEDLAWFQFWKVVLSLGLGSFFLLVLIVIPLGARDIKRLLHDLQQSSADATSEDR